MSLDTGHVDVNEERQRTPDIPNNAPEDISNEENEMRHFSSDEIPANLDGFEESADFQIPESDF